MFVCLFNSKLFGPFFPFSFFFLTVSCVLFILELFCSLGTAIIKGLGGKKSATG